MIKRKCFSKVKSYFLWQQHVYCAQQKIFSFKHVNERRENDSRKQKQMKNKQYFVKIPMDFNLKWLVSVLMLMLYIQMAVIVIIIIDDDEVGDVYIYIFV